MSDAKFEAYVSSAHVFWRLSSDIRAILRKEHPDTVELNHLFAEIEAFAMNSDCPLLVRRCHELKKQFFTPYPAAAQEHGAGDVA